MLNFFSDTQTLPTREMLNAIMNAKLGDDMLREDPTVNKLEEKIAGITGKEAALLVSSGTQGNLVCLMVHGGHGDAVFLDPNAHMYFYEAGALCSMAGYTPRLVADKQNGRLTPGALKASIRPNNIHFPRPRLLCLENTHNRQGGRILKQPEKEALIETGKSFGLKIHLDGARIWNASVALNISVAELCEGVDSVQVCLSKGLSCPIGSVVCGTEDFIEEARRVRKRLGGSMRQAGIIAACGLVAVQPEWIARLADDHRRARHLAELLYEVPGVHIDLETVETNMVYVDIADWKIGSEKALKLFKDNGLKVSPAGADKVRLVTHRHITDENVEEAAEILKKVGAAVKPV